jgi:DNA segregation ATPase FtsK/SpoIIIE, S-DNA-T family
VSEITLEIDDGSHVVDVSLPFEPETTIGSAIRKGLSSAGLTVSSTGPFRLARTGRLISVDELFGAIGLRTGDRIELNGGSVGVDDSYVIEVITGPDTGRVIGVGRQPFRIGRDTDNALTLNDASVSRSHAVIELLPIAGSGVGAFITDLGSANGTAVDGTLVTSGKPIALTVGAVIDVGDVMLAFHDTTKLPVHIQQSAAELSCNRPPRVARIDPPVSFTMLRAPEPLKKRPFPLITIVVPLLVGIAMGFLISPLYLLLGLASPLLAIGSVVEDRRSGRRKAAEEKQRWREATDKLTAQIAESHSTLQDVRRRTHPAASTVTARSVALVSSVWETRPTNRDFLETRAGTTDLPSAIKVVVPEQGADDLRTEMQTVAESVRLDSGVPLILDLAALGTTGFVGTEQERHELVSAQIIQLAGRHSPQDLQLIILAPASITAWDWCKWLPHAQVDGSVAVAADEGEADSLFHSVLELAEARSEAMGGSLAGAAALPHVVVVIEPPIPLSPREAAQLCTLAPSTSMSVLWLAAEPEQLPGACRAVVRPLRRERSGVLTGSVTFTEAGIRYDDVRLDTCVPASARRAARALAPLRDTTSGGGADGIPSRINLVDLLEPSPTSVASVIAGWSVIPTGIQATLGRGLRGPVTVDLRADGPHALVAGTTGAGKSELLQTWVASMAASYPPDRVTFVLIDYKGGAAFKDCIALPHTVGFVTDLDPHTAERAMVSLDAELVRREHILAAHGAKDLIDLEKLDRRIAPPNLVLIVDEFAALKAEMPDFVSGLVDIAQRGRSLGVHLVLATQKPGGVIDPKIQANTNLRIALRVANSGESTDVLGRPIAAAISRRTPGRAFVRIGETQMFEVQAGYVGAPFVSDKTVQVLPRDPKVFALGQAGRVAAPKSVDDSDFGKIVTDLQTIVGSCVGAAAQLRIPSPFKPWLDPLPLAITVGQLEGPGANVGSPPSTAGLVVSALTNLGNEVGLKKRSGVQVTIGLADEPARQSQVPFVLDLEAEGNVAVYGGPGVGKSTLLRTLATQLAVTYGPDRVHMYGLDFASRGLASLEKLPHCGGIVTGDQLDKVRRLIEMLASAVTARQEELAQVGAGTIAELETATGQIIPAIVVLIDGFGAFWQAVEPLDRSEHIQRLLRVAAEGRSVGVHLVYTADRRSAVVPALNGVTGARFVMHMPSPDEYGSLGFSKLARNGTVLPRGRVAVRDGLEFQVAVVSACEADGVAQVEEISRIGARLRKTWPNSEVVPVEDLPQDLTLDSLRAYQKVPTLHALIGLDDQSRRPNMVDFTANPLFFVVGQDQSGKSTTLETLARGLRESTPDASLHFMSVRRSVLGESPLWTHSAVGVTAAMEALAELRTTVEARARDTETPTDPLVVIIDDGDEFSEGMGPLNLEAIVKSARDANVFVLIAMSTFRTTRSFSVWIQQMRANRHGIVLRPEEEDGDVFNARLPKRTGLHLPPGRGYLFTKGGMRLTQVAVSKEFEHF